MTDIDLPGLLREAMLVMLKLGGPPLLAALVVGLLISLLQAITQINEATLAFVPKLIALGLALMVAGPFMYGSLAAFALRMFQHIVAVGGS